MTAPAKLLVLLPDLANDGAADEVIALLAAATEQGLLTFEAVAWDGGPRLAELRRHGPVSTVSGLAPGGPASVAERALLRLGLVGGGHAVRRRRLGLGPWSRHRPDAIYLSSPRSAPLLRYLPTSGPPVVVMVPHGEMTAADHEPLSDADRVLLIERADRFLVQTEESRERAIALGVAADKVVPIGRPLADEPDEAPAERPSVERLDALRARLAITPGTSVLVGAGPVAWRGGADLFVRTLWILRQRRGRDVSGIWVATATDPLEHRQLLHDISHMGLAEHVHVVDPEDEDALWLGDLLVLTSREPDEPPVYLRAARQHQAVVGFRTDRLDAFLADDSGTLSEFLDLDHLARTAVELLDDDGRRAAAADHVQRRYEAWHDPRSRAATILALVLEAR